MHESRYQSQAQSKKSVDLRNATRVRKRNLEVLSEANLDGSLGGNRAGLFAVCQQEDNACSSKKAKAVTLPAVCADRETRHPFACRSCWSNRPSSSSTRPSRWASPEISGVHPSPDSLLGPLLRPLLFLLWPLLFSAIFPLSRAVIAVLHLAAPLYRDLQAPRTWGAACPFGRAAFLSQTHPT